MADVHASPEETSPAVAAIIPAFNAERYLAEAVDSVLAQTLEVECIVVDDGSADATAVVAEAYAGRVRVVRQPNRGVSAARNAGARAARAPLLAFLDADDWWLPEKIGRQLEEHRRTGAPAVLCGLAMTDARGTPTGRVLLPPRHPDLLARLLLFDGTELPSCSSTLLVTREAFEELGGFDERLGMSADWSWTVAYLLRFGLPAAVEEPLTRYRLHDANMSRSVDRLEHDMLLAFAKAFADNALPPDLRARHRLARFRLHRMLAGSFAERGDRRGALRHLAAMARTAPARTAVEASARVRAIVGRSDGPPPD